MLKPIDHDLGSYDRAGPAHESAVRTYWLIFAALIGLTALTVMISFQDLGPWHATVGLAIATCKTTLVVLFFMHVIHASRLTQIVILGSLLFLAILIWLLLADYLTRPWLSY